MSCAPVEEVLDPAAPAPVEEVLDPAAPAPGGLTLGVRFHCLPLHATVTVRCCLLRQAVSERQRPGDGSSHSALGRRCYVSEFPSCTARCPEGAAIRELVAGAAAITWRGAGPGGRFGRERTGGAAQLAARRRLELVGALVPVPTLDDPPAESDEAGAASPA